MLKTAIIGAGAAGMMCAGALRSAGIDVTVFEKNEKPGRKLAITGKGRCNLTNNCEVQDFLSNVVTNPKFMQGSVYSFSPSDTIELFETLGVPLKTERGNRVFPCSDNAYDIVDALKRYMGKRAKQETVKEITFSDNKVDKLITDKGEYHFDNVVVATGGASYPLTGSTGDGYSFAMAAGHNIKKIIPSLVPLTTKGDTAKKLMGLSLRNVTLTVIDLKTGKSLYSELGEMLFTHFGVSGPLVLSASSHLHDMQPERYILSIDLKPALDVKKLDTRVLSDFSKYSNRDIINAMKDLLPSKLIPVFADYCEIDPHTKVNSITKEQRKRIVEGLKGFKLTVTGFRPIAEAIVTCGGVDTKEINPKTMESKLAEGLYFAGEVIDIDAYTGGFNLQLAFSSAVSCANAIIKKEKKDD